MITVLVFIFLVGSLVALVTASLGGALFALLTVRSTHIRWCLPSLALLVGFYGLLADIEYSGLRWQQPALAIALGWWVAMDYRPIRSVDQKYTDLWCGAVLKTGAVLLASLIAMIYSANFHHT